MECREIITNPICPACISRELEEWLKKEKEHELVVNIKKIETEAREESVQCIICRKPNVFLCPHCFTKKVYKMLKKNASQKLIEQFFVFFNYELK